MKMDMEAGIHKGFILEVFQTYWAPFLSRTGPRGWLLFIYYMILHLVHLNIKCMHALVQIGVVTCA